MDVTKTDILGVLGRLLLLLEGQLVRGVLCAGERMAAELGARKGSESRELDAVGQGEAEEGGEQCSRASGLLSWGLGGRCQLGRRNSVVGSPDRNLGPRSHQTVLITTERATLRLRASRGREATLVWWVIP